MLSSLTEPHSQELQPQFLCEQDVFSPIAATTTATSAAATATLKSVSAAAMYDRRHSNESMGKSGKAVINPFDPGTVPVEMNSHRCRWMHTFPLDKVGRAFQTHHLHRSELEKLDENQTLDTGRTRGAESKPPSPPLLPDKKSDKGPAKTEPKIRPISAEAPAESVSHRCKVVENFGLVRRKGMDWPSLTEPACLPITTDYFPDEATLNKNYSDTPAQHVACNVSAETGVWKSATSWRADHQNMNTYQAFREMISQRLSQASVTFVYLFACNSFSLKRVFEDSSLPCFSWMFTFPYTRDSSLCSTPATCSPCFGR